MFDFTFMDELESRFEGREIKNPRQEETEEAKVDQIQESSEPEESLITVDQPRGDWTEVNDDEEIENHGVVPAASSAPGTSVPNEQTNRVVEEDKGRKLQVTNDVGGEELNGSVAAASHNSAKMEQGDGASGERCNGKPLGSPQKSGALKLKEPVPTCAEAVNNFSNEGTGGKQP